MGNVNVNRQDEKKVYLNFMKRLHAEIIEEQRNIRK